MALVLLCSFLLLGLPGLSLPVRKPSPGLPHITELRRGAKKNDRNRYRNLQPGSQTSLLEHKASLGGLPGRLEELNMLGEWNKVRKFHALHPVDTPLSREKLLNVGRDSPRLALPDDRKEELHEAQEEAPGDNWMGAYSSAGVGDLARFKQQVRARLNEKLRQKPLSTTVPQMVRKNNQNLFLFPIF